MIKEIKFKDATSLWIELTKFQMNADLNDEIIYRGHSNAKWDLIPTVLRPKFIAKITEAFGHSLTTADQVWAEFAMLQAFVDSCDATGTPIPNDSVKFRDSYLRDDSFSKYVKSSYEITAWPGVELFEIIALAQLHGLPTRFLDWTTNPFRAVCFAVSQALSDGKWENGQDIAIFRFKKGPYRNTYCGKIRILHISGSVSKNVVNQEGLFTIHPVSEKDTDPVAVKSLEKYLLPVPGRSIQKLTVPVSECISLRELCLKFGFSVAHLFPTADGASKKIIEDLSAVLARENTKNRFLHEILQRITRTSPTESN